MVHIAEPKAREPDIPDAFTVEEADEDFQSGKIYCANCGHCKLIPSRPKGEARYVLRVRCDAGKWKKKLGEEKMYKYNTITRRYLDCCDTYEEMGDTPEFIRDLRKTLPNKDEQYVLIPNDEI
jgi:hypothetical protein